jgi:post-segregation antitoxin (ccd killing protein)
VRNRGYDNKAPKQTVSVTLNSDLYVKAKRLGINASQVAEEAIANEYAARRAIEMRAELEKELAAIGKYVEEHGCFAEMARAHYGEDDGAI